MTSKFCADIHNNLAITLTPTGVQVGACCWYKDTTIILPTEDIWNTSKLQKLRELNKQDKLDTHGCSQCIIMESAAGTSRRTGVNEYYKSKETDFPGPRGLEIKIDLTCNIACSYCGPDSSTQWRLELNTPKKQFPIRLREVDIISMLDQLDLTRLDNIHFHGGDPLFTNTHETILKYIENKVGLHNIYVWYNTNGTLRVLPRIFDLWDKCRLVKVFFSIDDIGSRFEYIRYGAIWNEVADNMLWYKDTSPSNVMFTLQPTMSCLNALNHYELLKWKNKNFDTNREGDFTDITRHNVFGKLELESMPDELRERCIQNNSEDVWFPAFLKSVKYRPIIQEKTKKLIAELDNRRGCNFSKTFPDLAPYFT